MAENDDEGTDRELAELHRRMAPINEAEERAVRELGDRIGYGRVMQLAEKIWDEKEPGAAHSTGPCTTFLKPCPCPPTGRDRNGHCEWCCGARRVTEKVLKAIADAETGN